MIQKEKQLLLKDLCARLPYGVKIMFSSNGFRWDWEQTLDEIRQCEDGEYAINGWGIHGIKSYLRPMSSMTEEEREDFYQNVLDMDIEDVRYENDGKLPLPYNQKDKFIWFENIYLDNTFAVIDWLNAHHFDYRGLIERGLAIAVTKENNPYEN